jgi:Flp pilus assembly protein TadD
MKWMVVAFASAFLFGGSGEAQKGSNVLPSASPALRSLLHQSETNLLPIDAASSATSSAVTVDYPSEGSIFPADFVAPTFQWRDAEPAATNWLIEVVSQDHGPHLKIWSHGEKLQLSEIDTTLVGFVPPTLTPEQAVGHAWKPDPETWAKIKKYSSDKPATIIISGYRESDKKNPVSHGQVSIQTSKDPVGAPIFYRDVPLLPPPDQGERGVIKPLPDSVLPKIKWQLRYVSEAHSKVVMTGLPTCANCHSVSLDGKTLGIDVDGPQNDKGLYGLIPIKKVSSISNDYVIHWSAFTDKGSPKRFGFMSQVSPEGKYVVTSIDVPGSHGRRVVDRLYNGFYSNYGFGQVFFPTRGVLAWYSRENGKLKPLPGADDPEYVQTGAFWSPDSKFIVFSRATARDPYVPGQKPSTYANDPNETQIQYDLYRIPFNDGLGGKAEPLAGASNNGMSNNFPKVSPDGKWIVFVQNKNGLLMRPDSRLFIIPAEGGVARLMKCNQKVMNSWHSFSPNGHWLVFSSKTPYLYTHMYLTHIDADGNDSPAIMIEDATAANRAVNIPEFMNIGHDGLEKIETPATDFYRQFDIAVQLADKKQFEAAVPAWKQAIQLAPDDSRAHNNLGVALVETGNSGEAIKEYRKSLELNAGSAQAHTNLGSALAEKGDLDEAISEFEKALEIDPDSAGAHTNLGNALAAKGNRQEEAMLHLKKGIELKPDSANGQNGLGIALARSGNLEEAIDHLQKAVALAPQNVGYRYNLGRVLAAKRDFQNAVPQFEEAARLSGGQDPAILEMLAAMYSETGKYSDAVTTARHALDIAIKQQNDPLVATLKKSLERYETMALGPQPPSTANPR